MTNLVLLYEFEKERFCWYLVRTIETRIERPNAPAKTVKVKNIIQKIFHLSFSFKQMAHHMNSPNMTTVYQHSYILCSSTLGPPFSGELNTDMLILMYVCACSSGAIVNLCAVCCVIELSEFHKTLRMAAALVQLLFKKTASKCVSITFFYNWTIRNESHLIFSQ